MSVRHTQQDVRRLKEKALEFFKNGKFARSAETWAEVCKADPKDQQACLRWGDALAKAGQSAPAYKAYLQAAEGFAKMGFLPQAIAAAKLALNLNPGDEAVQQLLSNFHAERFGAARPAAAAPVADRGADAVARAATSPSPAPEPSAAQPAPPAEPQAAPEAPVQATPPRPPAPARAPTRPQLAPVVPPTLQPAAPRAVVPLPAPAASPPPPASEPVEPADATPPRPAQVPVRRPHRSQGSRPPQAPPLEAPATPPRPASRPPSRPPQGGATPPRPAARSSGALPPSAVATPPRPERRSSASLPPQPAPAVKSSPSRPPGALTAELNATLPGGSADIGVDLQALRAELGDEAQGDGATMVARSPFAPEGSTAQAPELVPEPDSEAARIPLFAELTPAAFSALLEAAPMVRLGVGEAIVSQGAGGDSLFAILSGRVRVSRDEAQGRRELAILEPGAVFGELALLTGAVRSASVVAEVDDTTVLEVSKALLEELSQTWPSIAQGLDSLARRRILSNVMAVEPLFSGLKRTERLALVEHFQVLEVADGVVLLGPDGDYDGLFVLGAGQVEQQRDEDVVQLTPGAVLGDEPFLGGVDELTIVTTQRSLVLNLPRAHAEQLMRHPSITSRRDELLAFARRRGTYG
jgi:CRP-like cAMP-binding protein